MEVVEAITVHSASAVPAWKTNRREKVRKEIMAAFDDGGQAKLRRLDLALAFLAAEVDVAEGSAIARAPAYDRQFRGPLAFTSLGFLAVAVVAALTVRLGPPVLKPYGSLAAAGSFLEALGLIMAFTVVLWITILLAERDATCDRSADEQIAEDLSRYFTPSICKRAAARLDEDWKAVALVKLIALAGGTSSIIGFAFTTLSYPSLFTWQMGLLVGGAIVAGITLRYVRSARRGADIAAIAAE